MLISRVSQDFGPEAILSEKEKKETNVYLATLEQLQHEKPTLSVTGSENKISF